VWKLAPRQKEIGVKRKNVALGSGRIYHVKDARAAYKYAMSTYDRAIAASKRGDCSKAHDSLTVANMDHG
jgi:hypothetical protein